MGLLPRTSTANPIINVGREAAESVNTILQAQGEKNSPMPLGQEKLMSFPYPKKGEMGNTGKVLYLLCSNIPARLEAQFCPRNKPWGRGMLAIQLSVSF